MPAFIPHPPAGRVQTVIAFLGVYLFWGATFIAIKIGVALLPAPILAGSRMLGGAVLMLSFCLARGKKMLWNRAVMARLALIGVLLLSGGNMCMVWAERWLPAGLSALLFAVVPFYVAILEWILPRGERLRCRGVCGLILGVIALITLLSPSLRNGSEGHPKQLIAAAVLLGGALFWATGSVISRRMRLPVDPLVAAGWEMLAAAIVNLSLGTALGQWRQAIWTPRSEGAVGFLVVFGSLLGFSAFIWLIHNIPVAKVATYAYVNPVVAVILGALVLGERLQRSEYIGMALVVLAVALVTSSTMSGISPADRAPTPIDA